MSTSAKTKLTVVDFRGNVKLLAVANSNSSYNLNIAQLKAGNYLLKIEMNDEVVFKEVCEGIERIIVSVGGTPTDKKNTRGSCDTTYTGCSSTCQ